MESDPRLSNRKRRYVELAARVAGQSDFYEYRHGAVLVRGGSVLNTSCNKNKYRSWALAFAKSSTVMRHIMQSLDAFLAWIAPLQKVAPYTLFVLAVVEFCVILSHALCAKVLWHLLELRRWYIPMPKEEFKV